MDPQKKAAILAKISTPNAAQESADRFFAAYDTDKDGFLSMEELEVAHIAMKKTFAEDIPTITEEKHEQIKEYFMNYVKDEKISKEDFTKVVSEFLAKLRIALSN